MSDIKIYELRRVDLKGATVIDGFPSVGLVSSIVANYLINILELEQIGMMDSEAFPTVSLIRDSEPNHPVRIYAGTTKDGKGDKIVAFISEFQPPQNIIKPIAETIIDWAQDQWCSLIVCPEGMVIEREQEAPKDEGQIRVYGVGSTQRSREFMLEPNVKPFKEGVITGVAGVLLNEGKRRNFDVIALLAEAHPDYPDARAAARVIEILDRLLLHTKIDARPLYEEAERIETQLKAIQTTAKTGPTEQAPHHGMYG
jgi:uncharacterized protein